MFNLPKLPWISLSAILILYSISVFADYLAPYDPNWQNSQAGYALPASINHDEQGLFIYQESYQLDRELLKKKRTLDTSKKYYLKFFTQNKLVSVEEPVHFYLLGTDNLGRDVLSRLIHGSRPSLSIGFLGLLIAFPIGILYGGISGYFGGITDNLMMRLAEAIMSLPSFYLLIILSSLLPASLNNSQRFALITVILSFISWAGLARIIRGQVLGIKQKEFIEAAHAIGQKKWEIICKHLLPHTLSYVIIAATLSVPGFIIGETALSFLGLGINQPDPSWGNILAEGKSLANILTRPWLLCSSSLLIFITVFSFNMLGDNLRDRYDPRF